MPLDRPLYVLGLFCFSFHHHSEGEEFTDEL
ncbi:hypothetical protein I656_00737 [Geobacillus sp. WSUCF1]|nr:hypothetical protein I656_00737 [Geobacillus sp. WSUCF1]